MTARALKERNIAVIFRTFSALFIIPANQGRRASLRSALAPGYHIPRRWRCACPGITFRAVGAALAPGYRIPRRWRCATEFRLLRQSLDTVSCGSGWYSLIQVHILTPQLKVLPG